MATARRQCIIVLLLYSQGSYGQPLSNNQNIGVNFNGLQQRTLLRTPRNFNSIQNGPVNVNVPQSPNSQQYNPQMCTSVTNQENLQPQLNLQPNLQYQTFSAPQNNFQLTKIGFTPVTPAIENIPATSSQSAQNSGFQTYLPISQIANSPITESNFADLAALKGQSLLSLLNYQNNCQLQQNPQIVLNSQNQLTDSQKQALVKSFQGQNQPGMNVIQPQPIVVSMENQQPITVHAIPQSPQGQAIATTLGTQPAYITVQAQPLPTYFQNQMPQVIIEEEPSILSLILSELGPQYSIDTGCSSSKKGSNSDLKALIPLIVNLLKEKNNCGCRRCGCPPNYCQNNDYNKNLTSETPVAQVIEGYSNQKDYSNVLDNTMVKTKKNSDDEFKKNDKVSKVDVKKTVNLEIRETEEDDSEYIDDDD